MLKIRVPASQFAPAKTSEHHLNKYASTTLGSCQICDIKVERRCIDDVHLIIRYVPGTQDVLVRDNRTESGTFRTDRDEALNPRTFYKFNLMQTPVIELKAGDVAIEIRGNVELLENGSAHRGMQKMHSLKMKKEDVSAGLSDLVGEQSMEGMLGNITPMSATA